MRSSCTHYGHHVFCVWHAQTHGQNATKEHMVVAMPSDRSHIPLVEGTRSWRKVCHHDWSWWDHHASQIEEGCIIKDEAFAHATWTNANMHINQLSCCGSVMFGKYPLFSYCGVQSLQFLFTESGSLCWSGNFLDESFFSVTFILLIMACVDHLQLCIHAFTKLSAAS